MSIQKWLIDRPQLKKKKNLEDYEKKGAYLCCSRFWCLLDEANR